MRTVYLLTDIRRKYEEWQRIVEARYGVQIIMVPWSTEKRSDHQAILALLQDSTNGVPIAVCNEYSNLVLPGTQKNASLEVNLLEVEHLSTIACYTLGKEGELEYQNFSARTAGYIDTNKGSPEFGSWWDPIFIVSKTGLTYSEMSLAEGMKVSSRTQSISQMIEKILLGDDILKINFNPPQLKRPVDFRASFRDHMSSNPLLMNSSANQSGLSGLLYQAIRRGQYFRSRQSYDSRAGNYFVASLAGHPFVRKETAPWEAKFAFHDAGHSLNWRPLPIHRMSELERRVLIALPMVDEAQWLAAGELVFVDSLVQSGHLSAEEASNFQGWAAYKEMGWAGQCLNIEQFRALLLANTRYFVEGDLSEYQRLGVDTQAPAFSRYVDWFTSFSIQDWRWNWRNSLHIKANIDFFALWWELIEPINEKWGLGYENLRLMTGKLGSIVDSDLVGEIFNLLFDKNISPYYRSDVELDSPVAEVNRAFTRWAVNQLGLIAEHWKIASVRSFGISFRDAVLRRELPTNLEDLYIEIDQIRIFYEHMILNTLVELRAISQDDARLYAEIYPLFPRFSIQYEEPDATIKETTEMILGDFGAKRSIEDESPGIVVIISNQSKTKFLLERKRDDHSIPACRGCYSFFGGSRRSPAEIDEVGLRRELSEELVEADNFVDRIMELSCHFGNYRLPESQYGDGEFECHFFESILPDDEFDNFADRLISENSNREFRPEGAVVVISREEAIDLAKNTANFVGSLDRVMRDFIFSD